MEIKNKLIIVTGASSGIGEATAIALAQKGARVIILARTRSSLDKVAAVIKEKGGEVFVYAADLTDLKAVRKTCQLIKSEVGIPDIIVNNAGLGRWLAIDETTEEEAMQMMSAPYFAAFFMTRNFIDEMLARNSGHIINITSPVGFAPVPGATAYGTARWAMRGFSKGLEADLYQTGIRVSLVVPGKVSSEYFANNPGSEDRIPKISKFFPVLKPSEVARCIVKTIEQDKTGDIFLPFLIKLTVYLHRFFPKVVESLMFKTGWKRK